MKWMGGAVGLLTNGSVQLVGRSKMLFCFSMFLLLILVHIGFIKNTRRGVRCRNS